MIFKTYCIHQLIKAEYELCKRNKIASLSYTGVIQSALNEGPNFLRPFANKSV